MVEPMEHDHLQITLINPARALDELMPIALTNRPELAAQRAMIRAAEETVRREKNRPLLPTVYLTGFQSPGQMRMQGEVFGLGQGSKMNNWSLRDDVSMQLIWSLDGLGLGNLARIKQQRGVQSRTIVDLRRIQDAVVADVNRAQADLQSAAVRMLEAERSMREALITFDGNYEGLAQTQRFENMLVQVYRPQEAVMALENLLVAYDQYFGTVAEYNRAQFEMFHALGYPARSLRTTDAGRCRASRHRSARLFAPSATRSATGKPLRRDQIRETNRTRAICKESTVMKLYESLALFGIVFLGSWPVGAQTRIPRLRPASGVVTLVNRTEGSRIIPAIRRVLLWR